MKWPGTRGPFDRRRRLDCARLRNLDLENSFTAYKHRDLLVAVHLIPEYPQETFKSPMQVSPEFLHIRLRTGPLPGVLRQTNLSLSHL